MNETLFAIPISRSKSERAKGKVCTKCGKYKAYRFFYRDATRADGYRTDCKDCASRAQRASRDKMDYVQVLEKQCAACGRIRPIGEFAKDNTKKDGHRSQCKECDKLMHKHNPRIKKVKQPQSQLDITKAY